MDSNEKKAWLWWAGFLLVVFCISMMVSCGRKPQATKEVTITDRSTENTTVKKSDSTAIDRNKAIYDQLIATLGKIRTGNKNCDSICQEAMDSYLSQLNHLKQSGNNKYQVLYDQNLKQLKVIVELGETINELKSKKHDSIVYKDRLVTNTITKTETKYRTPDYMRYSAYLGWLFAAFLVWKASKKIYSWLNPTIT